MVTGNLGSPGQLEQGNDKRIVMTVLSVERIQDNHATYRVRIDEILGRRRPRRLSVSTYRIYDKLEPLLGVEKSQQFVGDLVNNKDFLLESISSADFPQSRLDWWRLKNIGIEGEDESVEMYIHDIKKTGSSQDASQLQESASMEPFEHGAPLARRPPSVARLRRIRDAAARQSRQDSERRIRERLAQLRRRAPGSGGAVTGGKKSYKRQATRKVRGAKLHKKSIRRN